MNDIPKEDGYYWVLLGEHSMHRVRLAYDEYTIIKIASDNYGDRKRSIRFIESDNNRWFRLKYFTDKAKFGEFIKIINPNKDI